MNSFTAKAEVISAIKFKYGETNVPEYGHFEVKLENGTKVKCIIKKPDLNKYFQNKGLFAESTVYFEGELDIIQELKTEKLNYSYSSGFIQFAVHIPVVVIKEIKVLSEKIVVLGDRI